MSWRDRALLLEALAIVSALPMALRLAGVQRAMRMLSRSLDGDGPRRRVDETRAREVARIVAMASRHAATTNTCLHRSLALWWLLGRRGLASELKMGARHADGRLDAHAWVEHAGLVVNDDPSVASAYTPLSRVIANTHP